MTETRPNFILFVTDQQNAKFLGCYGHPVLATPNIDAIAAAGVAFDHFYVASPVCMPNRSSLMTGRMPAAHGVRMNGQALSRQAVTFADALRAAGYDTALIGKSHLQNFTGDGPMMKRPANGDGLTAPPEEIWQAVRDDDDDPWYGQESPDWWSAPDAKVETPFYGFDHVELVTGHGDGAGGDYRRWLKAREPNAVKLLGAANQLPHDYTCPQAVRTALPVELYHTTYIAERAAAYVEARKDSDKPFFLMVSFPDPHHPFNPPGKYWDMYDPDDFPVPEAYTRNDWTPPPHVAFAHEHRRAGSKASNGQLSLAIEARHAQEAQALTAGMISLVDDAVGSVMACLDDSGRAAETVIAYTSDHGDHMGNHRLLLKGSEQYDDIVRVPFIWADPAAMNGGRRSAAVGSTIDIAATILDRARIAPYYGLQGESLVPVIAGAASAHRDVALIQYEHQADVGPLGGAPRIHTVTDGEWRLSLFDGVEWGELYNLSDDPGEFHNLWDDPAEAAAKARLMHKLAAAEVAFVDRAPFPTSRA